MGCALKNLLIRSKGFAHPGEKKRNKKFNYDTTYSFSIIGGSVSPCGRLLLISVASTVGPIVVKFLIILFFGY